jgi:acetyl-CoA carboxylase carboxyltransferase component
MSVTATRLPPTSVDRRDPTHQANRAAMLAMLDEIEALRAQAAAGGGDKYVQRHRDRGRLLVRERIDLLLDRDSPFLELSPLAGWGTDDPLGGGMVVGIGLVEGTECLLSANDPTVRGGTSSPTSITKSLRAQDIALRNRLPVLNLTESGGAELPKQADIFVPGGASFKNLTRFSAAGIPVVTMVFGSSTAGGAYVPGMSDYTIFVQGQAQVFLGGPPLVKMAIDEDADEEELGGAEMHARISGLADFLAVDEADALRLGRMVVRNLRWRKAGPGAVRPNGAGGEYGAGAPPLLDPDELLGIASPDVRVPFEVREVLWRVLDGSRFDEFKPAYGAQLVCGWGSLCGFPIGVLANNGILFSEESQKGAQFIQLCNRSDTPLLFVQNITGFMVGTRYEQGGIIKHGSQLINAVSNSGVPHLTLMIGASYGAGNYGMSGRAYDPRFVFTWPNHRIAVMGPKQLAGVMSIVQRQAAERAGREYDEDTDALMREAIETQIGTESTALFATGRQWDDGIIDPRDTRTVLGVALSAVHSAPVQGTTQWGVFRL